MAIVGSVWAVPGQAGVAIELKYPLRLRPAPFLLLLLLLLLIVIVIVIVSGLRLNLFFPVF